MNELIVFASAKNFGEKPPRRGFRSRRLEGTAVVLQPPLDENSKGLWTEPQDALQVQLLLRLSSMHFQFPLWKARSARTSKG